MRHKFVFRIAAGTLWIASLCTPTVLLADEAVPTKSLFSLAEDQPIAAFQLETPPGHAMVWPWKGAGDLALGERLSVPVPDVRGLSSAAAAQSLTEHGAFTPQTAKLIDVRESSGGSVTWILRDEDPATPIGLESVVTRYGNDLTGQVYTGGRMFKVQMHAGQARLIDPAEEGWQFVEPDPHTCGAPAPALLPEAPPAESLPPAGHSEGPATLQGTLRAAAAAEAAGAVGATIDLLIL